MNRETFTSTNLTKPGLFEGCTFKNVSFNMQTTSQFIDCKFSDCDFIKIDRSHFSYCRILTSKFLDMREASFHHCTIQCHFRCMYGCAFRECTMIRSAWYAHNIIDGCTFSMSDMRCCGFLGVIVTPQTSFWRCENMGTIQIDHRTIGLHPAPEGDLVGWKKVKGWLVKLKIPEAAERSCATGRKLRAKFAEVLWIDGDLKSIVNPRYTETEYKVGENVYPDSWDEDRWTECSHGIHFFLTRAEAEDWA